MKPSLMHKYTRSCLSKDRYATRAEAEQAAATLSCPTHVYECPWGVLWDQHFHVTTQQQPLSGRW